MKPFNLELAKAGHAVCTRDGRDARIICFDRKGIAYPVIALINNKEENVESLRSYDTRGFASLNCESSLDLMMKSTKKEGWINVFRSSGPYVGQTIYLSEEIAKRQINQQNYITTIKIEWEE